MFKAIASKTLSYNLPYKSDLSLNRSTIPGSSFLDNGFILEGKLLIKTLDKIGGNNNL